MTKTINKTLLSILLIGYLSQLLAVTENQLRVAYIYNIAKFVKWPDGSFDTDDSPINICIVGQNKFKDEIQALHNKNISGRLLNVLNYESDHYKHNCHIAYISNSNKNSFEKDIRELDGTRTLTISDIHMFADKGGMIELRKQNDKIRLYINLKSLKDEDIFLSSKILELSNIVKGSSDE